MPHSYKTPVGYPAGVFHAIRFTLLSNKKPRLSGLKRRDNGTVRFLHVAPPSVTSTTVKTPSATRNLTSYAPNAMP